ncbi:IS30 family transposase [Streptomyces sp. NPDC047987]|uniref:IS30 family transposase n=1 Tax=unclassified Streptomyces TaxID=2593676 RepID=UPI003449D7D7
MAQGMSNSAACREVGINRKTGTRWTYGRTVKNRNGQDYVYAPIGRKPGEVSDRFLSQDERIQIADLLCAGHSLRSIARQLGRSPSTISRELNRNRNAATGAYTPFHAQRRAIARRARSKEGKLGRDPELKEFVQLHLSRRWSPEQISRLLPTAFPDQPERHLSTETIYQAVYLPHRGGLDRPIGELRTRRRHRHKRRRPDQRVTRFRATGLTISQRPPEAAGRLVPGHWEGDLIVGKDNRSAIGTLVDRTTRYVKLVHLPEGRGAEHVRDALVRTFTDLPPALARSLTWDQGSEMGRHDEFTLATNIPVFFCEPGSPWQRPTNENTNGLLRQYFPKGTDLSLHSATDLAAVAAELNDRPRKTLGWQTPAHHFSRLIATVE